MQRILVMNAKGGCGKTTIATNLASYFAAAGRPTALFDYDPQGSSSHWLNLRPERAAKIHGVAAHQTSGAVTRSWQLRVPPGIQRVVIDTPAGLKGQILLQHAREADVVLVPVLPSTMDIHATAEFLRDLLLVAKLHCSKTRIALIANRVRANTVALRGLHRFLDTLRIPVIGELKDSQHYLRAAEYGIGVHELKSPQLAQSRAEWSALVAWLDHVQGPAAPAQPAHEGEKA